jgi:PBP1b-binding outer membrane lipoprotein LpoB
MTGRPLTLLLSITLLAGFLSGCDLLGTEDSDPPEAVTSGVYVANAGAFQNSNSSYTLYNPNSEEIQRTPSDRPGFSSYIQSLHLHGDRLYLMFGETNSVGVFDPNTNEQIGEISDIKNPRYMDAFQSTAYITGQDYSSPISPKLYEADLGTNQLVDSVEVNGMPEGVLTTGETIFVALGGQDGSVAVVDAADLSVEETLPVKCDAPRSLALDQQNELLVFCSGSTIYDENYEVVDRTDGAIQIVDPQNQTVTSQIPLDTMLTSASEGQRAFYAPQTDEAYAVLADQTILRFDAETNEIVDRFDASGDPIGAIGYDSIEKELYIGRLDPGNPFGASGSVTVHRQNGNQTGAFDAGDNRPGIAPTHIDFRRTRR